MEKNGCIQKKEDLGRPEQGGGDARQILEPLTLRVHRAHDPDCSHLLTVWHISKFILVWKSIQRAGVLVQKRGHRITFSIFRSRQRILSGEAARERREKNGSSVTRMDESENGKRFSISHCFPSQSCPGRGFTF